MQHSKKPAATGSLGLVGLVMLGWGPVGFAQESSGQSAATGTTATDDLALAEVTVTARRREESLQRVPDAVSAFTPAVIEARGIERLPDFLSQVPNLVFRDGSSYRQGTSYISMRGVGQGQEGWPP